eukprot:TRINITY_DN20588_c0_g1_i1.p1 TRINITY_DN20588_c0_g1~~TRINITY_DN20588_c0_g1_i1.p1  ORF type:complete len:301 (+),score=38.93 TRINITY_DN20588_c0_g1_i1:174-1076(+)
MRLGLFLLLACTQGAFPNISNPNLRYLGFFGQPDPAGCSYQPQEQHTFANLGLSSNLTTLSTGAALSMKGLFKVQLYLVYGGRLLPNWQARWANLSSELQPWVANKTVWGFHLGDELTWAGLPFEDLDALAGVIANTTWRGGEKPVVYYNDGKGAIVDGKTCAGDPVNFSHVPAGIDWISFDYYNPPASIVRGWYETGLYPKMLPHQHAVLVPGASGSAHWPTGPPPGWDASAMVDRAHEYFAWAAEDPKVVGLIPWHWKTLNYSTGGHWELGIESIPELVQVWSEIGHLILAREGLPSN